MIGTLSAARLGMLAITAALAALGSTVTVSPGYSSQRAVGSPMPIHEWATAIAAGGVATQDAATIDNPTADITRSTTSVVNLGSVSGVYVTVQLAYDDGLTSITSPVIELYGRAGGSGTWIRLPNRAGATAVTLTTATTDVTDGTLFYTAPSPTNHIWDRMGCDEFLVGVTTALAGTGTTSNAVVRIKGV